jgi:gas vesicle protein
MGTLYDRGTYEEEVDGDFSIFRKKYTDGGSRSTHFEPIGNTPGILSNDPERWTPHGPSAYDPFPMTGYQMSGIGRQDIHSRREEQARNYEAPLVVGLGDVLGYSYGSGLGDISWSPFSFSAFPAFAKTTAALSSIASLPTSLFSRTLARMKAGPGLTQYTPTLSKTAFTSMVPPVIANLAKLEFSLTDISGVLKSIVDTLTDGKIKAVWDAYDVLVKDKDTILNNIPTSDDSIIKRAEKVVNVVKKAPDLFTHFNNWAKIFVQMSMDGFKYMRNFSDNVVKTFTNIPGKIQAQFDTIMGQIKSAAQAIIDQVWGSMTKYTTATVAAITETVTNIGKYVKEISSQITNYLTNLINDIQADMKDMITWITARVKDLVNGIVNDMGAVKDWILSNITGLSTNIRGNIETFGSEISTQVKTQLENFKTTIDNVKTQVTTQFNDAVAKAKGELTNYVNTIQTQFQGKIDALSTEFKTQYTALTDKIKDATASVTSLMDQTKKVTELVSTMQAKVESYAPRLDFLESKILGGAAPTSDSGGAKKGGFFSSIFG